MTTGMITMRKEMGIRKVLGASVPALWRLLSREYVWLVLGSSVLAAPLAYYVMDGWLSQFDYRAHIPYWVFLVAAGSALVIALATVSYHAIKAALANPTKALRTE